MLIRSLEVKTTPGLLLLLPARGLEKLAPRLARGARAACSFPDTFVSQFNLVLGTRSVYVDLRRFGAEMDGSPGKCWFSQRLYK